MPSHAVRSRLEKLERSSNNRSKRFAVIWQEEDESCEQARARYLAQKPDDASAEFVFVTWIDAGQA